MDMSELKPITVTDECGSYSVYSKSDVDTVIEEKDRAIEFAKALTLKDIEIIKEKDKEIAELKKKLMPCLNGDCILTCEVVEKYGKENAELKRKLESVQATAYAESVDAGMRERKLKRALYKACANWADVMAFEETEGIGYDNSVAERWRKMESKCLKKAEKYK
jgi:hypothetical protein